MEVFILDTYKSYGRNNYNQCTVNNMNRCMTNNTSNRNMAQNRNSNMCSYRDDDCNSEFLNLNKMPLAMAYVPMQQWNELYKPATAICEGTAFPELNKIFCGVRGR